MSTSPKDQLFFLIQSLSKAEKRHFKLYAKRTQSGNDGKFIQLFDALDRAEEYDEAAVLNRLPTVKKRHLPNLKRHLYKQILTSLRLIHIQKNIDIQIREQIDFARILYGKGMYMQSLRTLERCKQIAIDHHQDLLHLEILDFQKMIEARHITRSRSVEHKMDSLLEEAEHRSTIMHYCNLLSNLNIKIHGWYIDHGHARTPAQQQEVQDFLHQHLSRYDNRPGRRETFFERVNLNQIYLWYHYIRLDFGKAAEQARQWVNLFGQNEQMQQKDPDLYMRGLYYLLVFLFITRDRKDFKYYLDHFQAYIDSAEEPLNPNSQMIGDFYLHLSRLNYTFLIGDFQAAKAMIPAMKKTIETYQYQADPHRILLFYYKFAWVYFSLGQFDRALDYLNKIVLLKHEVLREELYYFARLLQLMCLYERKEYDLMTYQITSLRRSMGRSREKDQLLIDTVAFLKKLIEAPVAEHPPLFANFRQHLNQLMESPENLKSLVYLNIPVWVDSHLHHCSIAAYRKLQESTVIV